MLDDKPLFLGPKAENLDQLKAEFDRILDNHAAWRKTFHREDPILISAGDMREPSYTRFFDSIRDEIDRLTQTLQAGVPFFSPRYVGHMNADVLIPALLGYFAAMLYNPNNVTSESSPVTTMLEIACGIQLAGMAGYLETKDVERAVLAIERNLRGESAQAPPLHAWGHLTSGGTAANIEAIWVARNLKYFPLAVKAACNDPALDISLTVSTPHGQRDIRTVDDWVLLNIEPDEILELRRKILDQRRGQTLEEVDSLLRSKSVSALGLSQFPKGVLIAASTAHYSVPKLADILGIGRDQILHVPVDRHFHLDVGALEGQLERCRKQRIPIIALISVFGSTEEGAVDDHAAILKLRRKLAKGDNPLRFYWHCDAAYGGYALSIVRNPSSPDIPSGALLKSICDQLSAGRNAPGCRLYLHSLLDWQSMFLDSAEAIGATDSITIDPHKWGYIPYPCGAIVFRRQEVRDLTSVHAPYVFHSEQTEETRFIGRYILEGSKPGAAAAACWLAHRMLPLNQDGYGELTAQAIRCSKELHVRLQAGGFERFRVVPLNTGTPDLNIVCFAINQVGNTSLHVMNGINQLVYETLSPTHAVDRHQPVAIQDFFVSKTDLAFADYRIPSTPGATALDGFLRSIGIAGGQFLAAAGGAIDSEPSNSRVTVIRCTVMGPWLLRKAQDSGKTYLDLFIEKLQSLLSSPEFLQAIDLMKALASLKIQIALSRVPVAVLIAEDEPSETVPVVGWLRSHLGQSVSIREAKSTLEAIEMLKEPEIRIAVLDVDFPSDRLGGVTSVYRHIRIDRADDKHIPCILYTKYDVTDPEFSEITSLVHRIGASDYILLSKQDRAPHIVVKAICGMLARSLEQARVR